MNRIKSKDLENIIDEIWNSLIMLQSLFSPIRKNQNHYMD